MNDYLLLFQPTAEALPDRLAQGLLAPNERSFLDPEWLVVERKDETMFKVALDDAIPLSRN